ncbi:hypothetical protein C1H46_040772 [Malus baccata]|uniref:Uncharacterized protein n=1 Tax=Malus baccata TaxID=106549 RepID=A0A540KHN5_MALBA|nr:hypothetical protein C1H46_040772 [Malus baccata]
MSSAVRFLSFSTITAVDCPFPDVKLGGFRLWMTPSPYEAWRAAIRRRCCSVRHRGLQSRQLRLRNGRPVRPCPLGEDGVKTTKRVVKETVEVSVVKTRRKKQQEDRSLETISVETNDSNQTQNVEVSVGKEPLKTSIIPIETVEQVIPIETQAENQTLKTQNAEVQVDREAKENPTTPDPQETEKLSKEEEQKSEEDKTLGGGENKDAEDLTKTEEQALKKGEKKSESTEPSPVTCHASPVGLHRRGGCCRGQVPRGLKGIQLSQDSLRDPIKDGREGSPKKWVKPKPTHT